LLQQRRSSNGFAADQTEVKAVRSFLITIAAVVVLGCEYNTVCTLVGCHGGLTVEIINAPPGALTVQASVADSSPITVSCPGTTGCSNVVVFLDFTPAQAQLTITTTAGVRQQAVTPKYATLRPNGASCGPTCHSARVSITWQ
jgi:hypothetical protein